MQHRAWLIVPATAAWLAAGPAPAQQQAAEQAPDEVTIGEPGSAQDPLAGRDRVGAAEPDAGAATPATDKVPGVPAIRVKIDPRVLGVAPGEPLPRLRREGESVRKRDGQLLPTGERGYAVFIFDADPEQPDGPPLAMVVAPCLTLESMERLLEDRGADLRFTVTGQVHTYRGVNYLLPTAQPKPWLLADLPEPVPSEVAGQPSDQADTVSQDQAAPAAEPVPQPGDNKPAPTPSADDVLDDLLQQRRDAPEPIPAAPRDTGALRSGGTGPQTLTDPLLIGLDPDQPPAELLNEGEFLIARTGRLIRSADGAHALFVLDADQANAPEPPMIVHACKLLEQMEQTVREQGDDVPFVVTGQVFIYRGANYLLPTLVKREFDRGNLE